LIWFDARGPRAPRKGGKRREKESKEKGRAKRKGEQREK
jgi:hypothetical protein